MWELARQSAVLGMDETPVMELGGPGRTLKGYLWAGVGDADHPYDCFFYSSDRRSIRAETMLAGFEGYLTADAYVAYERIGQLWPGVFKTSCWVHARRKFEACHHLGKTEANTHGVGVLPQAVRHRRPSIARAVTKCDWRLVANSRNRW